MEQIMELVRGLRVKQIEDLIILLMRAWANLGGRSERDHTVWLIPGGSKVADINVVRTFGRQIGLKEQKEEVEMLGQIRLVGRVSLQYAEATAAWVRSEFPSVSIHITKDY